MRDACACARACVVISMRMGIGDAVLLSNSELTWEAQERIKIKDHSVKRNLFSSVF